MCGRKTLTKGKMEIIEELSIKDWDESFDIPPNYNVAPTTVMPILLYDDGRIVRPMRWGLIPHWTKDASAVPILINAERVEITKGAASLLYGSDALGGAVNLIPYRFHLVSGAKSESSGAVTTAYRSNNNELMTGRLKLF